MYNDRLRRPTGCTYMLNHGPGPVMVKQRFPSFKRVYGPVRSPAPPASSKVRVICKEVSDKAAPQEKSQIMRVQGCERIIHP